VGSSVAGGANVLGARTLGSVAFLVVDGLTFAERVEVRVLDGGAMEKELAVVAGDETKTLVGDEFLDRAPRHERDSLREKTRVFRGYENVAARGERSSIQMKKPGDRKKRRKRHVYSTGFFR
jgi:hypothetical protein